MIDSVPIKHNYLKESTSSFSRREEETQDNIFGAEAIPTSWM